VVKNFFATIGVEFIGSVFCGGVEEAGEVERRESMLKKSFNLGIKLAKATLRR